LSTEEAELIRSDQEPPAKALYVPWQSLLRYREAWVFCIGKMLTDLAASLAPGVSAMARAW
jgi:hypothetical protein